MSTGETALVLMLLIAVAGAAGFVFIGFLRATERSDKD